MSRAGLALLAIIGGVFFGSVALLVVGFQSGDIKLSNVLPAGATDTPEFRARFLDSAKKSCIKASIARAESLGAQKIEAYCDCYSKGAVDLLTEDDVRYMIDHIGSLPADLVPKLQPLIAQCRTEIYGR